MKKLIILIIIFIQFSVISGINKIQKLENYYKKGNLKTLKSCLDTLGVYTKSEIAAKKYFLYLLDEIKPNIKEINNKYSNTEYGQKIILLFGKRFFLKRQYKNAIEEFLLLGKNFDSEKNIWLAQSYFKDEQWRKAIIFSQKYITFSKKSYLKDKAYLIIAISYEKLSFYDKSINTLKFLQKNVCDLHFIPEITYRLGRCYDLNGDSISSLEEYSKIINNYSYSPFFIKTENILSKRDRKEISKRTTHITNNNSSEKKKDINKKKINKKKNTEEKKKFFVKGKYYVQAGAYSSMKYAKIQNNKIAKLGLKPSIHLKKKGNKKLLTVNLGPFDFKKDAIIINNKLKNKKIKSYIFKL